MRLVTVLLATVSLAAAAQTSARPYENDTHRIIAEALAGCFVAKDEAYASWPPYSATAPVIVEETHYVTFGALPTVIAGRQVEYLSTFEVAQRARQTNEISVVEAGPIFVVGDTLSINLSDSGVSWKRRMFRRDVFSHGIYGGCVARFVFAVTRRRFEFVDATVWGV